MLADSSLLREISNISVPVLEEVNEDQAEGGNVKNNKIM